MGRGVHSHETRWLGSRSDARHHPVGLAACGETHAAFERRSIPPEPPPHRENWRFAALIVAFRSEYTRYSSLTRLVSRAPRPHRENWPLSALTRVPPKAVSAPHPKNAGSRCAFSPSGAMGSMLAPRGDSLPARPQCRDLAARSAAGEGCGEGFPLPTGKGGENREAILDAAPGGKPHPKNAGALCFSRVARCGVLAPRGDSLPARPHARSGGAERRRGGVWGGVSPPGRRVGRIAKRFSTPPRGGSAPHPKNAGSRCAFSPGGAMRGACPSGGQFQ